MAVLQCEPLVVEASIAAVRSDADGAVALFVGVVRNQNAGRSVRYLQYEAYPEMALRELERLERRAREAFPGVSAIDVRHRLGRVEIGEASVVVAVAAAHREAALAACADVIEQLKRTVPIWKKEHFDGGECWIEGPRGS